MTKVWIAPVQLHSLVMACFASLIAPFGGFFASGVKRAFNVKDFGQSIPGHGGLTDRFDCQFLMGVFSSIYYQSFIKVWYKWLDIMYCTAKICDILDIRFEDWHYSCVCRQQLVIAWSIGVTGTYLDIFRKSRHTWPHCVAKMRCQCIDWECSSNLGE